MKKNRIKALINLLDDPDTLVFETVEKELLKENHTIIPALEKKWENSYDETCQERIENLIQNLQFKKTRTLLKEWITTEEQDLLEGFLAVDRFQYPDINQMVIFQKVEKIKNTVWLELNDSLTLLEKITILNHFLFNIHGFSINHKNIHSPQNCYLNQLLDTKRGNPVSLSLFYTILARKLGLPAYFVDFPKNPLIAIVHRDLAKRVHGKNTLSDVLFYINPSNKGSIASRKEVGYHLKKNNYSPQERFAEPQPDSLFLQRLLESLQYSFQEVGFSEKKDRVHELLKLFAKR
ncbi:Transglutaminase-like superfamily protein [Mariniphaga anaerophila]|uniref:Transglutaminase-like superfamily protein n=1 Tax=Mariniphaga anaerophila TaxID=1484053 RepID=A0A1M4TBD8_9BACT|nr:transglutaminase-like domain-containing protein [Mariniphaga anaerophila]SHE41654.1 Transglutaminase-like superfamily protein [Mariniphaga anaerophila]